MRPQRIMADVLHCFTVAVTLLNYISYDSDVTGEDELMFEHSDFRRHVRNLIRFLFVLLNNMFLIYLVKSFSLSLFPLFFISSVISSHFVITGCLCFPFHENLMMDVSFPAARKLKMPGCQISMKRVRSASVTFPQLQTGL